MLHDWDLTPREAIALQKRLRASIRTDLPLPTVEFIAGVDVAYVKETGKSVATVCLLTFPELELVAHAVARLETPFPYVPGLLSFREMPPILEAVRRLDRPFQLLFVDGHGQAHPRRFGIASHLGLWLKQPTIGIGKSRLVGRYDEPGQARGARTELVDRGEVIGTVLRTRDGVKPIFVSVGYGLPLPDCVEWTLRVTPRFRLPEPIRQADRLAALHK